MHVFLLLFVFFAQDKLAPGARFAPITAGNRIDMGCYHYVIPDGCYYADEENVHHVFQLPGADYIPNAVGMFFSTSATWDYSVTVQHFPFQAFALEPKMSEEDFQRIFSHNHLFTLAPIDGEMSFVQPPTFDSEHHSFTIGIRYPVGDGTYQVVFKKLWVTSQDGLLFSVKATEAAFNDQLAEIEGALNSVEIDPGCLDQPAEAGEVYSYLELLGLTPGVVDAPAPQEKQLYLWVSALLLLFAGVVIYIAVKLYKKQAAAAQES